MIVRIQIATSLLIAAIFSFPPAPSIAVIASDGARIGPSILTASIMSDEYTTYRRARGDASRVGYGRPAQTARVG